ncbi:MAG TPA: hypothetical protein PLQ11_01705 [Beijerinckiaceae bacterium]|nr:hypothetical protein [Beijerinckiaceae bacterium]
MPTDSAPTGFVYAAIAQNEVERGYVKIGYCADPPSRYASRTGAPYRRMLLIQPDRLLPAKDHVAQGAIEQQVLDFFRRGRGMLYEGRAFPPGYAELVRFDEGAREALDRRLRRPNASMASPEAMRFIRTLLAMWEDQMPVDPWSAQAVLPDLAMVPPQRRPAPRINTAAEPQLWM